MAEAYLGSSGITIPIPIGYILEPIKLETNERTLDGTLITNYAVNSEDTAINKYHFELPGITQSQRLDIRAVALVPGNMSYIDHIQIPEVLSGDGEKNTWTLQRPLASADDIPVITVNGISQEVTIKYVGSLPIDRSSSYPASNTLIVTENPATFTGKIVYVEIFAYQAMASVTVATFTQVSDNVFTVRDSEFIGDVGGDFKRPFEVDLDVVEGDFIGIYWGAGYIERDNEGSGYWIKAGNQTSGSGVTFEFVSGRTISLYANETITGGQGNVLVDKNTGIMDFITTPTDSIGNIKVKYVPNYTVHIVSDRHELLYKTSTTDHTVRYNLVLEEA